MKLTPAEIKQQKATKAMYLIYRFPGLKNVVENLMSPSFGRFIQDVNLVAAKPTTFNVKLINDQENESKSLVEACGLKWENDCLNFHENKKPIKTLSITQARQKIYKTSLNLSENYKVELKELFSILSK